ncbi:MAG: hypothetical protein BAJALOKI1v1_10036 [Promethearchaeota archaeon]|nr:MAG: hypothetical protein BAJALOKI1v1_10036 [Candidatus Lokiarchaeota archaeon]
MKRGIRITHVHPNREEILIPTLEYFLELLKEEKIKIVYEKILLNNALINKFN